MRYGILILLIVCLSGSALGYDWATSTTLARSLCGVP